MRCMPSMSGIRYAGPGRACRRASLTPDCCLPHHPGMDRRRFLLTSLPGAFAAALAAEAQPAVKGKVYRIGFIGPETPIRMAAGQGPFWDRMRELGWVYGQNVVIEYRVFGADQSRIPEITR